MLSLPHKLVLNIGRVLNLAGSRGIECSTRYVEVSEQIACRELQRRGYMVREAPQVVRRVDVDLVITLLEKGWSLRRGLKIAGYLLWNDCATLWLFGTGSYLLRISYSWLGIQVVKGKWRPTGSASLLA